LNCPSQEEKCHIAAGLIRGKSYAVLENFLPERRAVTSISGIYILFPELFLCYMGEIPG
jgi:hypothetical protein